MKQHAWHRGFHYWEWFFAVSTTAVVVLVWNDADPVGTDLAASAWIAALVVWYLVLGRRLIITAINVDEMDARLAYVYRLGVVALFIPLVLTERDAMPLLAPVISHLFWLIPLRPTIATVVGLSFTPVLADVVEGEPLSVILWTVPLCTATAGFSVAIGVFIHRVIDQSNERFWLVRHLEESRAEVARLSHEAGVAAERRRLAAELHDTVTQGLSSIVMLAQAARAATDERLRDEHQRLIEQTARASLTESRAMVGALTDDETVEVRAEASLAELADAAGAAFTVEGEPRPLASATAVVLVRAAQEALRNVDKHATGADVRVRLAYRESDVAVSVADDGPGFDPAAPASGFGLLGTRNRVIGVGGTFEVDSAPGRGSTMKLEVPA